jgi:iron complex outermembrane receptor protein/hemoglobin/transferrin/lactoferrin receptor protein/vitamin B12 transporter
VKDVFRKTADLMLSGSVGNHSIKFLPYWSENESRNLKTDTSGETYAYYNGRNEEYGFQLQDAIKLGEHRLTAGIDYNTATYQTGRQSAPGVSIAPYSPDGKTANLGVFAESSLKLMGGKLVVTPGVRYA